MRACINGYDYYYIVNVVYTRFEKKGQKLSGNLLNTDLF